ncbi:MAG: PhoH family protein [Alphaproteobacteria bacterium]|nr:PhoH family protein [Alphaproteobacteria bacterium]
MKTGFSGAPRTQRFRNTQRLESAGVDQHMQETSFTLDDNRAAALVFGDYDQNIARLEKRLGVMVQANGNYISIKGEKASSVHAAEVLKKLYQRALQGWRVEPGDVDGAIEESTMQGSLFPRDEEKRDSGFQSLSTRKRGLVRARNQTQDRYLRLMRQQELVIAEGPAGTGKTWLAVGHAVSLLEQGAVERLVLSRPAVEAGERLGFLPGDMREKVDPYLRPIFDALHDFMDPRIIERCLATNMIEVAPLAFMRGRTLSNACILLDEAQNTTTMQMKMFLTRLGEGSRMIVSGDPTQIDLPAGQTSGLIEAVRLLKDVEGIGHVVFRNEDVVRHDLVARIVQAYEKDGRK